MWRSRHTHNTATPAGAMNAFTAVEQRGDPRAPPPLRLGRRAYCARRGRTPQTRSSEQTRQHTPTCSVDTRDGRCTAAGFMDRSRTTPIMAIAGAAAGPGGTQNLHRQRDESRHRQPGGRAVAVAGVVLPAEPTPGISIPATGGVDSSGCRPRSVAPILGATPRCHRHTTSVTASLTATAILRRRRLRLGARGNVCPGHPCPCGRGAHGRRSNALGRRRRRRIINLRLRLHRSPDRRRGGRRRAGH